MVCTLPQAIEDNEADMKAKEAEAATKEAEVVELRAKVAKAEAEGSAAGGEEVGQERSAFPREITCAEKAAHS